ncbi:hypothetical protein D0C36_08190 [Mucilaginibacter conchicola]|uniref:Uncharacterized protein n=1 Tax=Mucilaginibacter conchicola TaxID=2303333 RepID=A0A372NZD9_9SPHI|nr:hypothetical protein [Mucilaginibacter conchicola]RFZ95488.1 hypothetical protein D0C36_08190 [Mucilaginibacter conchicola]
MQDKDFDRLFSDKLGNLEVEPSRGVWKGISAELDSNKRRPLGIYLSIAASLLVMLTVGIYFLTRNEEVKPKQQIAIVKPKIDKPEAAEVKADKADQQQAKQPLVAITPELTIAKAKPVHARKAVVKEVVVKSTETNKPVITEPVLTSGQDEQLAQLPVQKAPGIKFTVPNKTTPLVEKIEEPMPVNTVAVQPVTDEQSSKTLAAVPTRKHKIRGIGDLLNAVVSKIDKRKDKLIEFSSKDEDEPNVTGLNLGFIKIKKQSR